MDWSSIAIVVVVTGLLMLLNRKKNKWEADREKRIAEMISEMERIQQEAQRGRVWVSIEEERSFLEHRLNTLWGLSEIKKSLDRMNDEGEGSWKGTDEEEEEIAWVRIYCQREIRKIGLRLRELDAKAAASY